MTDRTTLRRMRDRFQQTGSPPTAEPEPRADVLASWLRCRERYRVDPTRRLAEVRTRPSEPAAVQVVADPILDSILPAVEASEHLLLLADERGQLLRVSGYRPLVQLAASRNIVVGSVWDEGTAGTNGIGTALEAGHSLEVVQDEHYCEGWQDLTCTGGLVHHPVTGRLAGVVDVTGYRTLAQPHTLAMVEAIARLIEREWSAQIIQRAWLVAEVYGATAARYRDRPVLAFDADGHLVRANAPGCSLLGLDPIALAEQALPLAVAGDAAEAVAAALGTLPPGDIRARDLLVPVPPAGAPSPALLVPVRREGRLLGGIAVIADGVGETARLPSPMELVPRGAPPPLCRIVARGEDGRLTLVDVHQIAFVHADSRGVWLHAAGQTLRSTYQSLQALADVLPPSLFIQANRADLVNLEWLAEIDPVLEHSFDLILCDPPRTRIPISRRRLTKLREMLHF